MVVSCRRSAKTQGYQDVTARSLPSHVHIFRRQRGNTDFIDFIALIVWVLSMFGGSWLYAIHAVPCDTVRDLPRYITPTVDPCVGLEPMLTQVNTTARNVPVRNLEQEHLSRGRVRVPSTSDREARSFRLTGLSSLVC